jgi:hypothetical protein
MAARATAFREGVESLTDKCLQYTGAYIIRLHGEVMDKSSVLFDSVHHGGDNPIILLGDKAKKRILRYILAK